MEILQRRSKNFDLAATYTNEGGKVLRPCITLIPKGFFNGIDTFDELVQDKDLVCQLRFMDVQASSVEELERLLDLEERRLSDLYEKRNELI